MGGKAPPPPPVYGIKRGPGILYTYIQPPQLFKTVMSLMFFLQIR
jgi:hypothetical protein